MKSDDWEFVIALSAIGLFCGSTLLCSSYVTRRRYPDGPPGIPGFGLGAIIAISNFFVGWKNVAKWQLHRVMIVWTLVILGWLSFYPSAARPTQRFNLWILVPFAIAIYTSFEIVRLAFAATSVERMREKPNTETVAAVIRFGRRAVPELIRALTDDEAAVRSAAAEALGTLGESASDIPALRRTQSDAVPFVAQLATEAILKIDPFQKPADVN